MRGPRAIPAGLAAVLVSGLVMAGCGGSGSGSSSTSTASATAPTPGGTTSTTAAGGPCGTLSTAPAAYDHVIWITFENLSFDDVIGNTGELPFVNQLAGECGLATRFFPEVHPSLPNYLAMTSGDTQGVTGDGSGPLDVDNIYRQVTASGREWRHYSFGMPDNCHTKDAPSTSAAIYSAHHEPVVYYSNIATDCARWNVPVSPGVIDDPNDVVDSQLAKAIDGGTLPAFTVIGPTDDGGDPGRGGEVDPRLGDPFLRRWVGKITSSATYRAGRTAIFITWDEGSDFKRKPPNLDNIVTIVVAPSVPAGTASGTRFDHYSMLRTTEQLLGLHEFLGKAADARSMARAFHLLPS